jgi:uncharacterized damage-inducible protein DinB
MDTVFCPVAQSRFDPAVQVMTCTLSTPSFYPIVSSRVSLRLCCFLTHKSLFCELTWFIHKKEEDRLWKEIIAMITGLPDFFQYNLWANLRMLDACTHLSDAQLDATTKGIYGSVRETLIHMFAAEEGYARTLTGKIPTPALDNLADFPGFDELLRHAKESGEALIAFAGQVQQGELSQILHLDGGTYDAPVIIVVIQAIDHAIDHRSQIATLLSQQGIEPPDLDAWAYNDTMSVEA